MLDYELSYISSWLQINRLSLIMKKNIVDNNTKNLDQTILS